jgi:hypothetical protein
VDHLKQISGRRRDDLYVTRLIVIGTEPFDPFLIDRFQKPYLYWQCYVADFIQEEDPSICFLK